VLRPLKRNRKHPAMEREEATIESEAVTSEPLTFDGMLALREKRPDANYRAGLA
jgi:hypothetical protein